MLKPVLILPCKVDYDPKKLFEPFADFDYDIAFLCSESKERILKKDVDLNIEELEKTYDVLCPVGAEPLKYVAKMTGITKYNGVYIENKYFPIINPGLINFKPQYEEQIRKAFQKLSNIVHNQEEKIFVSKLYEYIDGPEHEKFLPWLEKFKEDKLLVTDIETTALSPRRGEVIGIAFSSRVHEGVFISAEVAEIYFDEIQELFDTKMVIFHNAKFDVTFLKYDMGFCFRDDFHDTMLMHYTLNEAVGTHGLKPLALEFTDLGDYERELDNYKKDFCKRNKIKLGDFNYGMLPIEILSSYACKDGDATMQLYEKFWPLIRKSEKFLSVYNDLLIRGTRAIMQLESNGGPVDRNKLEGLIKDYEIDIEECLAEISSHEAIQTFERLEKKTFNPNSYPQVRKVLFDILHLTPWKKTDTGEWSVDKEVMASLDHPLCEAILDLREKTKLLGTYIRNIANGIDDDDRLRSNFNIHGTTSGRLSSSGVINYQNIPRDNKDIKKLFTARPGYKIVQCDLGTAEVYYAAALSTDDFLQNAFKSGLDFHSYVAKQMFNIPLPVEDIKSDKEWGPYRQIAKAITFGIMYQAGPYTIAEQVNLYAKTEKEQISVEQAKQFINKYFSEAKQLKRWIEENNDFIKYNCYTYSFFNRKRRLPEVRSGSRGVQKHAIRSGVNFLIQSIASDINLLGLCDLMEWIKSAGLEEDIIPFTIVHDSIVSEVREDLIPSYVETTREFLQSPRGIEIEGKPIGVDFEVGPSWGELQDYDKYISKIAA